MRRHRAWGIFLVLFCLMTVVGDYSEAWAGRTGGRIGGSSGFARSRSTPSQGSPGRLSQPTPSGSPRRSGGDYVPIPVPIGGGYGLPGAVSLGRGGGNLFTSPLFLVLLGFVALYFIIKMVEQHRYAHTGEGEAPKTMGQGNFTILKLQLALLSTARFLQDELAHLAEQGDTSAPEGLATLLHETVVLLSRHPEYWRYGHFGVERAATLDETETLFQEIVAWERAKFSEEVIQNVEGRIRRKSPESEKEDGVNEFIVVTVIVATHKRHFASLKHPSVEDISRVLTKMGGIISGHMLALEILWTPATPGDVLTQEAILLEYSDLQSL